MVNTIFFYTIEIRICLKNNLSLIVEFGGEGRVGDIDSLEKVQRLLLIIFWSVFNIIN